MTFFLSAFRPFKQIFLPARLTLRHCSGSTAKTTGLEEDVAAGNAQAEPMYAYNDVEKKKGLLKPFHTVEEQIGYMKSKGLKHFKSIKILFSI